MSCYFPDFNMFCVQVLLQGILHNCLRMFLSRWIRSVISRIVPFSISFLTCIFKENTILQFVSPIPQIQLGMFINSNMFRGNLLEVLDAIFHRNLFFINNNQN